LGKNIYTRWFPDEREFGRVMIDRIEDIGNVLRITLKKEGSSDDNLIILTFDPYVACRNMNESYRARTFAEKGGFKTSLFIVAKSSWVTWLHEESLGYYLDNELIHYSIITGADCLDIISEFPPEIKNLQGVN
jgi:hypothetical protein